MRTSKIIPIQSAKVHRKLNISLLILCYQVKILNDLSCTPTSSKSYNHTLLKLMHPSLCSGPLGFVCIITMWRQLNLILITVNALCNTPNWYCSLNIWIIVITNSRLSLLSFMCWYEVQTVTICHDLRLVFNHHQHFLPINISSYFNYRWFNSQRSLESHQRTHTNAKPFMCHVSTLLAFVWRRFYIEDCCNHLVICFLTQTLWSASNNLFSHNENLFELCDTIKPLFS